MAGGFKLQSVLNYRQALEEQAQQALALSCGRQRELLLEIERQQQELQQQDRQLKQRQQDGLTVAEIDLYETRIHHCRHRCLQLTKQLEHLEQTIATQRETLLQAARERQILVKLKEKQELEQRQEEDRKERSQLDEISLRNKGNGP